MHMQCVGPRAAPCRHSPRTGAGWSVCGAQGCVSRGQDNSTGEPSARPAFTASPPSLHPPPPRSAAVLPPLPPTRSHLTLPPPPPPLPIAAHAARIAVLQVAAILVEREHSLRSWKLAGVMMNLVLLHPQQHRGEGEQPTRSAQPQADIAAPG